MGGMDVLNYINKECPETAAIMMTGYATIDTAVEAMKLGAIDYAEKPVRPDEIKKKIDTIINCKRTLQPEKTISSYQTLRENLIKAADFAGQGRQKQLIGLIGEFSNHFNELIATIRDRELILIEQREALTNIGALAEEGLAQEELSETCQALFKQIKVDSNKTF